MIFAAIMFLLVLVFVVVGDFIEPIPAIIIFMPVVTALTETADIKPVHMGVVLIVTLAFGLITPPYGLALLMASKFVGTTFNGGTDNAGVVYKLDPAGQETVLYTFTGGADGANPYAGVVRDPAGNLYGTTQFGGKAASGVVFKLTPQ